MEWFSALSESGKVALIGAVIAVTGSLMTVIVGAILGYRLGSNSAKRTMVHAENVARLHLKSSASHKIADFRKEWIENLRVNLAEFLASKFHSDQNFRRYEEAMSNDSHEKADEYYDSYIESQKESGKRYEYVRLCLNANEERHNELANIMRRMLEETPTPSTRPGERGFITVSKEILKIEWDRLSAEIKEGK